MTDRGGVERTFGLDGANGEDDPIRTLMAASRVSLISRVHTMHPTSDTNLKRFLEDYEEYGCFFFMAVQWSEGQPPELLSDTEILIREIHVREA